MWASVEHQSQGHQTHLRAGHDFGWGARCAAAVWGRWKGRGGCARMYVVAGMYSCEYSCMLLPKGCMGG